MTYGPQIFFLSRSRLDPKTLPGTEFSCMCGLSYRAQSWRWSGKKSVFGKYFNLNSNNNSWIIRSKLPTCSKKTHQKSQSKKQVSGGEGVGHTYPHPHLVVKLECIRVQFGLPLRFGETPTHPRNVERSTALPPSAAKGFARAFAQVLASLPGYT